VKSSKGNYLSARFGLPSNVKTVTCASCSMLELEKTEVFYYDEKDRYALCR